MIKLAGINLFECIYYNKELVILLIKSDETSLLKSVTDWLLPVLAIVDHKDYFIDMCGFIKRFGEIMPV